MGSPGHRIRAAHYICGTFDLSVEEGVEGMTALIAPFSDLWLVDLGLAVSPAY
jgi:hypothetical protein